MPRALSVCNFLPFPVISGGRKRHVRLLAAMEAAGATPYLLTEDATAEGEDEARARGWDVEVCARPAPTVRLRARQHALREVLPHNPRLWQRARKIATESAFVQLEELGSVQYVSAAAGRSPVAVSLYIIDSEVMAAEVPLDLRSRLRHRYHLSRVVAAEHQAARTADMLLCVSKHDESHFRSVGGRNCVLAPNGVDDTLFEISLPVPRAKVVFFFGQFGYGPNADGARRYIEDVWPAIVAAEPEARLRIAGPGSRESLGSLALRSVNVDVLGFVPELADELTSCRLVVAPLWAGGGTRIKVLEAMAAGRPVVGTPLGVERLGFVSGQHGLSAESGEALISATLAVLRDDELANTFAARARELARSYRWALTTAPARDAYRRWIVAA